MAEAQEVKTVRSRTKFDRQLARVAVSRIWEALPGAITREYKIVAEMAYLKSKECDLPLDEKRFRLDTLKAQHTVIKETIIDRTVPALSRTELRHAMQMLPLAPDEEARKAAAVGDQGTQREAIHKELSKAVQLRLIGRVEPEDGCDVGNGTEGSA